MYLIATHIGTLALFALFVVMRAERGTFLLGPVAAPAGVITTSAIFFLALLGFGSALGAPAEELARCDFVRIDRFEMGDDGQEGVPCGRRRKMVVSQGFCSCRVMSTPSKAHNR